MVTLLGFLLGVVCVPAVTIVVIKLVISTGMFFIKYAWVFAIIALVLACGMCAG